MFFVSASSGERYNGGIRTVEGGPAKLIVNDIKDGEVTVDAIDIVYLKSVDQTFISRLDLLLSIGYTLTKENNNHQFSSRINIDYMANTFAFNGYYSMVHNYQTIDTVKTTTKRTEGGIGLQFFIIRDWFATVSSNLLQSSEQKLNLRAVTKGGIGNYMVKNYKMFF